MSRSRWLLPVLALLVLALVGPRRAPALGGLPPAATAVQADPAFLLPPPPPLLAAPVRVEARLSVQSHDTPADAPTVVVHAPAGVDLSATRLVIYLHGWEGCARAFLPDQPVPCRPGEAPVAGWGLAAVHAAAGTNSVLVVPQLAWRARTGDPGRFREPGFAAAWLQALVDEVLVPQLGLRGVDAVEEIVLAAHSGGYLATLQLLRHGELPVRAVVLLDALYGGGRDVAAWVAAAPGRRAVSLHTGHPGTTGQSALLARLARPSLPVAVDPPDLEAAVRAARVVVAPTRYPHGRVPEGELARLLRALPG